MACFCPECKLVFDSKRILCPNCGFGTANDDREASYHTQNGYTLFVQPSNRNGKKTEQTAPTSSGYAAQNSQEDVTIDHSAIYSNLLKDYEAFSSPDSRNDTNYNPSPLNTPTRSVAADPQTDTQRTDAAATESGADFFAWFADYTPDIPDISNEPDTTDSNTANDQPPPNNSQRVNTPGNDFTGERNRIMGAYRRRRFFSRLGYSLRNFRWGTFFRVLLIGIVIAGIAYIWIARDAILAGIFNIITGLLPTALVIIGIIWVIRSLFR